MASQCKRQQCSIDRRGFRQELDSWRHKLIHCVGFESILEGLFDPELVEDLKLFKDFEPVAVSDWSFDENCIFCCLRRDKVKEHLIGLSKEGLEDAPKPLLVKDQTTINRLEKQAEEFLHAVLNRKDVPNISDPHIPVVAREILQKMIRQFAAEYTSKTSPPQDSHSESQSRTDQSLPTPSSLSGPPPSVSPAATATGPAHNQNPVLSKLLMADQDAPLDLTIKKPPAEPTEQDGVLDLSIKKNRYSSSSSGLCSPCLSPATPMIKRESTDLRVTKAKELQSTSTLEQFMAKLCHHHQRQIVDAMGFLQTEVKALASSNTSVSGIQGSTTSPSAVTPEKSGLELRFKSRVKDLPLLNPSSCAIKKVPVNAVSLKTSVTTGPSLDVCSPGSGSNLSLVLPTANPADTENIRHGDHAPLKMKIMASNVADGKKLSCVLNASLSSQSDTSDDRQGNSHSSHRTETYSARLSSSVKKLSHTNQMRHKDSPGNAQAVQQFSVHMNIASDSLRTARKTARTSSDSLTRDSACRRIIDPDLGHCDIVFIDKPITECFKEQQRSILPRRNARKSTRGHMYSDEYWELKTVRTLAGRGNCPNPMPELITLVTPKQMLSKPEGVPPVDMPFTGSCSEATSQQVSTEESDERAIPGTGDVVEVADGDADVIVETSQTDQSQTKVQSAPTSPLNSPTESREPDDTSTFVEQDTSDTKSETAKSGTAVKRAETPAQSSIETGTSNALQQDEAENTMPVGERIPAKPSEDGTVGTAKVDSESPSDELCNSEAALSPVTHTEGERAQNESQEREVQDEQHHKPEPEMLLHAHVSTEESSTLGSAEEPHPDISTEESGIVASAEEQRPDASTGESSIVASADDQHQEVTTEKSSLAVSAELQPANVSTEESGIIASAKEQHADVSTEESSARASREEQHDDVAKKESSVTASAEEPSGKEVETADNVPLEMREEEGAEGDDLSSKTLDALLKELPPWRRKRGTSIAVPKRFKKTETVVVGYFNKQPIYQSDRSLRRSAGHGVPSPRKTPVKSSTSAAVNTSVSPTVDSPPENKDVGKCPPQKPTQAASSEDSLVMEKTEVTESSVLEKPEATEPSSPLIEKSEVTESSSVMEKPEVTDPKSPSSVVQASEETDTPSETKPETPKSKILRSSKQSQKQPRIECAQDQPKEVPQITDSKRQLRSASQKSGSLVSPASVPSTSSQKTTDSPQSAQQPPTVPPMSTDSAASPPQVRSNSAAAPAPSQQNPAVASSTESHTPVSTTDSHKVKSKSPATQVQSTKSDNTKTEPVSKRILRKDAAAMEITLPHKSNEASFGDRATIVDECRYSASDKPTKTTLRELSKPEMLNQSLAQSPPQDSRKLALRSQTMAVSSPTAVTVTGRQSSVVSPIRFIPERTAKALVKQSSVSGASVVSRGAAARSEPPKQTINKFFEALTGEENQHLITNLNIKYDKMQKGWLQMDKDAQAATKYKNKSDRQAAIWKSKRRAKKAKSSEHQKFSPVQMLFMKGFNLSRICRWFLESTETKSLVIVKKVNTRLPSETQLCFHSSSSGAGTSQGVFPSVQAERLKKHLKKFAIASPVKSNPKSQKLIAKALEQEPTAVKGKERREPPSMISTLTRSLSSADVGAHVAEMQKSSGKSKNPTSARILRKYSNIRGKMQVQQSQAGLKKAAKTFKLKDMKKVAASKAAPKSDLKAPLKPEKSPQPAAAAAKPMQKPAAQMERRKTPDSKTAGKNSEREAKTDNSSKAKLKTLEPRKELPKRSSQRLESPKMSPRSPVNTPKSKADAKKSSEPELAEAVKPAVNKMHPSKAQTKEGSQGALADGKDAAKAAGTPQRSKAIKPATSPDPVLTRSQRKADAASPASPRPAPKRAAKPATPKTPTPKLARKSEEAAQTRTSALKPPGTRSRSATKAGEKRAGELLQTPAKRTRLSLAK